MILGGVMTDSTKPSLLLDGPVQIYASGFRNAYDFLITRLPSKEGRMYTVDNGANGGWGGHPDR